MMKLAIRLCIACLLSGALIAQAQTKQNDIAVEQLLKNYGDSWSTKDPSERRAKLQKIWMADGSHESPFGLSSGMNAIDKEIDGFVKAYPNAKIELTNIQRTGKNILAIFAARNPDGTILFHGTDYFEVNENGQLKKVVGFVQQGG